MRKAGKPPVDRILRNNDGETVDEVVVHDCTVHIEQMTDESYWIGIYKGDFAIAVNFYSTAPIRCLVEDTDHPGRWQWGQDRTHI